MKKILTQAGALIRKRTPVGRRALDQIIINGTFGQNCQSPRFTFSYVGISLGISMYSAHEMKFCTGSSSSLDDSPFHTAFT